MSQTQWPQVTPKAILQATLKQLLTLEKEIPNKNYWGDGPPLSCPHRHNRGFRQLYWCYQHSWSLRRRKYFQTRVSGGAWTSRTSRQVSRNGVGGSTPVSIENATGIFEMYSPDLIVMIETYPTCGINLIQEVGYLRQSNSPGLVRKSQKLDAAVDINFPDNCYLKSIFSKLISDKLSNGSSWDLYMRCRMNRTADTIQTHTPHFVDLGLSTSNALNEGSGPSTPATRIWRPTDGAHWSATNHILVKLQRLDWARQSLATDITIKLSFKLKMKIRNLSAKFFKESTTFGLNSYWYTMSNIKNHLWTRLLLVRKCHTSKH